MRACPKCRDECPATAIYCIGCGAALLPFAEMVKELRLMRERSARSFREPGVRKPQGPKLRCAYCGARTRREVCAGCSDLPALHAESLGAAGKSPVSHG